MDIDRAGHYLSLARSAVWILIVIFLDNQDCISLAVYLDNRAIGPFTGPSTTMHYKLNKIFNIQIL